MKNKLKEKYLLSFIGIIF